ncbi:hypothetical protein [Actinophytocola sp.]|uniref:hypothetical protein n=1 Tax=Actinophytocola sp. TaxID=1872138 RepID=UPI002D26F111|nr:hypothetical protein [Actinophytocola sp.]HYQ67084.1 hypothetical protein [Actinophytocola sp.]
MTVFVSYARCDNDMAVLQDIEDLLSRQPKRILKMLTVRARRHFDALYSPLVDPYIDDLHHRRYGTDRHEAVAAALLSATSLLAVQSAMYGKTFWTAKEFNYASNQGMKIFILAFDKTTIDLCAPEEASSFGIQVEPHAPELV